MSIWNIESVWIRLRQYRVKRGIVLSPGNDIEMHGNDAVIGFSYQLISLKERGIYGWWCVVKIRY